MWWTTLLPMVIPALTDVVRGLGAKITGGAGGQPQNVSERIALMQADTERLKALATIDTPEGTPSQIIVDFRASFRYVAILLIWVITGVSLFTPSVPAILTGMLIDLSGATMSFIIGERMYFKLSGNK